MACAVCGFIVNLAGPSESEMVWKHFHAPDDHPVVPVPYTEVQANLRCDFCLADNAEWTLPVEDYLIAPGNTNIGSWAVCDQCAEFILADDWRRLTDRAHREFCNRHGHTPRSQFKAMYDQLRPHILGRIYR